jgi:hypothetical protein
MDIQTWAKKMQRLIVSMPDGYEGIVSYGGISVHPKGTLAAHHLSRDDGYGLNIDSIADIDTKKRLIPYSEGT